MTYPVSAVRGGHAPEHLRGIAGEEEEEHSTTYSDLVLAAGPVLYWPLWESSGIRAEELAAGAHGTYSADVSTLGTEVGIGDDNTGVTFGRTPAYVDIYSATLDAVWDGDEFTIIACCNYSAAVNADGRTRRVLRMIADGDNGIIVAKSSTEGDFSLSREAGGLYRSMWGRDLDDTEWQYFALTISLHENRQYGYRNGVEIDDETGLLIAWDEIDFNPIAVLIGAEDQAFTSYWKGGICHVAIFAQELSAPSILALLPPGII